MSWLRNKDARASKRHHILISIDANTLRLAGIGRRRELNDLLQRWTGVHRVDTDRIWTHAKDDIQESMTARYAISTEHKLKYVQISGKTHLKELRALAEQYFADPLFDKDIRFLVDLTDLLDARARFIDVFTLHGFYKRSYGTLGKPVDVAIVAPTGLGYGLSRMFAALMSGGRTMNVRIFGDMSDALLWLDVELQTIESLRHRTAQHVLDGTVP